MLNTYSSSTASKQPQRYPENYPKWFERGKGAYVWDSNGNRYLDFCCSLGAITLGCSDDVVDLAVIETIKKEGEIFSLSSTKEWILADLLAATIPCAEMSRFLHNGKDATEAAIRLARYITGKELILTNSYHGAADVFMCITEVDKGVPRCLKSTIMPFDYGNKKELEDFFNKHAIAGVILEPSTTMPPDEDFLPFLRFLTKDKGAILIFDEIVTFPRYPSDNGTATSFYGVEPDLMCIGKGIANGYAFSALCGKREYMKYLYDNEVFVSTTHGGNLIGVSATIATLVEIKRRNMPMKLNELGRRFKEGVKKNKIFEIHGPVNSRLFFKFKDPDDRWKLYQETIKEGVFFSLPIFFNYAMTNDDIDETADKINTIVKRFDNIKFEGHNPSNVFKRY